MVVIHLSSFVKSLFQSFIHLHFFSVFIYFLLKYKSLLSTLESNPLSNICNVNIFPPVSGLHFDFLNDNFHMIIDFKFKKVQFISSIFYG